MHKIGLKLWNINTDYYYDEAIRLYKDKVFDYIELYIVPGHLDLIDKWSRIEIPLDIHAPHFAHNMNLSKKEFEKENLDKYLEVKKYADSLNAEVIVFHGGINGDYKETTRQIKNFDDNRILIENKPYRPLSMPEGSKCIGYNYDEIKYIIENANCGFCLDVGHAICSANTQGINSYSFINELLALMPKRIHLSDIHIDSLFDEHLNFGKGDLDFTRVLNIIPDYIPITIETLKISRFYLDDFEHDCKYLRSKLLS